MKASYPVRNIMLGDAGSSLGCAAVRGVEDEQQLLQSQA